MGFKIGKKLLGGIKKFADKAISAGSKKLGGLLGKVTQKLPGMLQKLKGKLPAFMQKFAGKFLDKASSWIQSGPLAGLQKTLENVKSVDDLKAVWKSIGDVIGGFKSQPAEVRQNATELASQNHARIIADQVSQQFSI